jgi:hypothetical protein
MKITAASLTQNREICSGDAVMRLPVQGGSA